MLQQDIDALLASYTARNLEQAERQALVLLQQFPDHPLVIKVLAGVYKMLGRPEDALVLMQQLVERDAHDAEAQNNLGVMLKACGRIEEAIACYRKAIQLAPDFAAVHNNLGNALAAKGEFTEAAKAFEAAVLHDPVFANAFYNLGDARQNLGDFKAAEQAYRSTIRLKPDHAEAYVNLGAVYYRRGQLLEAEAMYREAIRLQPELSRAHNNLGNALKDLGRLSEAITSYRMALRQNRSDLKAFSNLLFSLNYFESLPVVPAVEEAKAFGHQVSAKAVPKFTSWFAHPADGRLRVGLVSGDLRSHPVGYFIEGLVAQLGRGEFELYAFPTTYKADALTERIKPNFRAWLPIAGMSDEAAAKLIHNQGVDILIDLSGHTAHNRLSVFAHKPAPVQATWLGYFATTGLPEMDFFIGDPIMAPASEAGHFTERLCQLAETWLCLAPPDAAEPVGPLPALKNGFVTFGCFGNLAKMNDAVVALWSRVLLALPDAKLFLKAKQLAEPRVVAHVVDRFAQEGVTADRLIVEGPSSRSDYFQACNRIDVVLDTFPYPGGTTSVDALWMGVPVLTLKGDRFLSHLGESIAINAGLAQWVAQDTKDYVNKAVKFANDLQSLSMLRANLRGQVLQSPLMQPERFAKHFGEALWAMWQQRQHA